MSNQIIKTMKKNRLLDVTMLICNFLCLLLVIAFSFITFLVIYWHVNPDYFGSFKSNSLQSTFGFTLTESWTTASHKDPLAYKNIMPASLYFSYIHLSSIIILTFLALMKFNTIMKSVRLVQTFQKQNVKSFRMIGKYLLLIFLLSSFSIVVFEQGLFYGFVLNFTPLALMCVAFIMAEIFEEGNSLLEDNQLTV